VEILGQGFSKSSVVEFGGVAATTIALTGTTYIDATVPAGALSGPVTVNTGTTTLTSPQTFKVLPTIATFDPPSGPVGTIVTINGTGLTQTDQVTFDKVPVLGVTRTSDTQISVQVPVGAKTGKIAITTNGGTATSSATFTVN
jgi:IPT/TIG domain